MRGCLFTLGFGVLFAVVLAWFALPPLAGALVVAGLEAGGLESRGSPSVEVRADPPLRLLTGQAETVVVVAEDVRLGQLEADHAELTLLDVDLLGRSFEAIDGDLERASVVDADGAELRARRIRLEGPASRVAFELVVGPEDLADHIAATLAAQIGGPPDDVRLEPPARVVIDVRGLSVAGRLDLTDDGALVLVPDVPAIPTLELFRPPGEPAIELASLSVVDGDLVLHGTLDATSLFD